MIQYAGDHDDRFPPLVDASGALVPAVDNAGVVSNLPSRTAFAVLLKDGYITTTKAFVCKSEPGAHAVEYTGMSSSLGYKDIDNAVLANGLSDSTCSYGWDPTKTHAVDATCAIIADKPRPIAGSPGTFANNSENHSGGEGQNVFYNDGHVKWQTTPRNDSLTDNDIYTGAPGYETSLTDALIRR